MTRIGESRIPIRINLLPRKKNTSTFSHSTTRKVEVLPLLYFESHTNRKRGIRSLDGAIGSLESTLPPCLPLGTLTEIKNLVEYLKKHKRPIFVDLGCGEGNLTSELALGARNCVGIGIDYYHPPLSKNHPNNMGFIKHDLNQGIPLKNQLAALVIAYYISRHLKDPIALLNEMIRICQPGGYLFFNGLNRIYAVEATSNSKDVNDFLFMGSIKRKRIPEITIYYNGLEYPDTTVLRVHNPSFRFSYKLLPNDFRPISEDWVCEKSFFYCREEEYDNILAIWTRLKRNKF